MVDNLRPEDRRKTMRAVKGKGTKLEKRLSSMLAGMSLKGWKQNVSNITGKPDVVFFDQKVVIFVDGCFWHGCPVCQRKLPETNREYWARKITRNVELSKIAHRLPVDRPLHSMGRKNSQEGTDQRIDACDLPICHQAYQIGGRYQEMVMCFCVPSASFFKIFCLRNV